MKRTTLRAALVDTVPVMTGYVCLGFGFGILMEQNGMGLLWALGLITLLLHLWKRNTLLSIAGGTVFYMLLVQRVF